MAKQQYNFRLDPDLMEWVDQNAPALGAANRTDLLEKLLEALREGRLLVRPRAGPNPFPASGEVEPGTTPDYPILVAAGVSPSEKKESRGWFVSEVQGVGIANPQSIRRDPDGSTVLVSPGGDGQPLNPDREKDKS